LANEPIPPENVPANTGIVVLGGIPALDQLLRPDLYTDGTSPADVNRRAVQGMSPSVPRYVYDGTYGDTTTTVEMGSTGSSGDLGILPTPGAPNG
jgi:hypothetical protein